MRIVWLLAVLLAATACSSPDDGPATGPEPSTPTATPTPPDVDFESTVTMSAQEVTVEWSLTNRSGDPLLVTNRVPDSSGRISTNADTVYVLPGADDGEVSLAKQVLPVSADAVGDSFPWIGVTEVAPGASIEERLRVPLPLEPYAPPGSDDQSLPDPFDTVVFCLGVLVGRDESWGFHDQGGVESVNHGRALSGQSVLCSEPSH